MISPMEFLTDLFDPDQRFLLRALAVCVMCSVVCGAIGTYVVLRGLAFMGDAVGHAVFPGLAIAFVTSSSLLVGGLVAGAVTALLITVVTQDRRLREDSVIGVLFAATFALGIVIISQAPGYSGTLQNLLFGSVTGIRSEDLQMVTAAGLALLVVRQFLHKELVAVSLDRDTARATGVPIVALDVALYLMITAAVVISVQAIGNVLVLALLVTPAATARLVTARLAPMLLAAPAIGAGCSVVGVYLSWGFNLPVGGTIVLVATAAFVVALLLGGRVRRRA